MGCGTGPFKSNISPLIAEQAPVKDLTLKTLKNGEKVIIDPVLTTQRIMLYFYMLINLGSLAGQIGELIFLAFCSSCHVFTCCE